MSEQDRIDDDELEISEQQLRRIRERVLQAEKEKLHLDLPRGINNEIEEIIREEIN
jgi:Na+/phosphate symporter